MLLTLYTDYAGLCTQVGGRFYACADSRYPYYYQFQIDHGQVTAEISNHQNVLEVIMPSFLSGGNK